MRNIAEKRRHPHRLGMGKVLLAAVINFPFDARHRRQLIDDAPGTAIAGDRIDQGDFHKRTSA